MNGAFAVTVRFSEAVAGFDASDVGVTNGAVSGLSVVEAGREWSATVTPAPAFNGRFTVTVPAGGAASDPGGVATLEGRLTLEVDQRRPQPSFFTVYTLDSEPWVAEGGRFFISFWLDEAAAGLEAGDCG